MATKIHAATDGNGLDRLIPSSPRPDEQFPVVVRVIILPVTIYQSVLGRALSTSLRGSTDNDIHLQLGLYSQRSESLKPAGTVMASSGQFRP